MTPLLYRKTNASPQLFFLKVEYLFLFFSLIFLFCFSLFIPFFEPLTKVLNSTTSPQPLVTTPFSPSFITLITILFCCYGFLSYLLLKKQPSRLVFFCIFLIPSLVMLCTIFVFPRINDDVFYYILFAKTHVLYHQNSYITIPLSLAMEGSFEPITNVYGPLWTLLSFLPILIAPSSLILQVLLMKTITTAFFWLSGLIFYCIVKEIFPQKVLFLTLLYLWNPALLFEFSIIGHNDSVMIFWFLCSLLALRHQKNFLAIFLLTLSCLTKFISALFLPIFLYYILFSKKSTCIQKLFILFCSLVIISGSTLIMFYPFWEGIQIFQGLFTESSFFLASLPFLLEKLLGYGLTSYKAFLLSVFIVGYGIIFIKYLNKYDYLFKTCYLIIAIFLLVACFYFMPWYVAWLFPLALLTGENKHILKAIIFSYLCFMSHAIHWQMFFQLDWYNVQVYRFLWYFGLLWIWFIGDSVSAVYQQYKKIVFKP